MYVVSLGKVYGEWRLRLSFIVRTLRLISSTARNWTVAWLVLLLVQGTVPAITVYLTKWVVDSIAIAVGQGLTHANVMMVLIPSLLMAGVMLLQHVLGAVGAWVGIAQSELVQDRLKNILHEKAASVDYALFEHADFFDRLSQANSQASSRTLGLLQTLGSILQGLITLITIAALLIAYGWLIPVIVVVSTVPAFLILLHYNKRYHAWWKANTQNMRKVEYLSTLLTQRFPAAELRMYDLSAHFREQYNQLRRRLRTERIRLEWTQIKASIGASLFALMATGVLMGYMVIRSLRGAATLGDLALFYQAFNHGQGVVRTILGGMGKIHQDILFLEHLYDFLDTKSTQKSGEVKQLRTPFIEGIRFEEVTFSYPRSSTPAIKNFSLFIPAGKTIAIVGSNGAGKSTVTKLICRLFDPDEGRITLDGTDLTEIAPEVLRRHIAIMFQNPVTYQMAAKENIAIGQSEIDLHAVAEAARAAGAAEFLEKAPKGYETMLGRYFGEGIELSGGEWQKVALARAYFKPADIYILDEPTSSMDSWAEQDWLDRFKVLSDGKTVIIITHRFTTAMKADYIHVMEAGSIVESGTHEELLEQGGLYAQSWTYQIQQKGESSFSDGKEPDGSSFIVSDGKMIA